MVFVSWLYKQVPQLVNPGSLHTDVIDELLTLFEMYTATYKCGLYVISGS